MSSKVGDYIKVAVVDDHSSLRELLVAALSTVVGFKIVGSCADAEGALEVCRISRPHVLVLDAVLPGKQGPEAVKKLIRTSPSTKILIFSGQINPISLRLALDDGATGYLPKSAPVGELVDGIKAVHAGKLFWGAGTAPMIKRILAGATPRAGVEVVSHRERDVLAGIAAGRSSKEIAENLGLSSFTVENHRRRIMDRTGIRSIAGLTLFAVELGLVTLSRRELYVTDDLDGASGT